MLNHMKNATVWLSLAALGAGVLAPTPVRAQEQESAARKITKKVLPVYPEVARRARITGTVKMTAVVTTEGDVKSVRTTGGNPLFVPAAEEAVKQWKFEVAKNESTESIALRFENPS